MNLFCRLTDSEKRPLWKVHNWSVLAGTAAGVACFFGLKRVNPNPPISPLIPSALVFFTTFRGCQQAQRPALYEKLLQMDTPLGDQYISYF